MAYTTWGSVRGCCDHVHRTEEAAEACISKDRRDCMAYHPSNYSDRSIRVIEGRADLESYSTIHGPGEKLRVKSGYEDFD